LRPVRFTNGIAPSAAGSTLIEWGNTRVICAVTADEDIPRWMKEQGVKGGWLTAEYSMLPYSTLTRKPRDIAKGKIDGRSQEIQRLIGRAMRSAIDLERIGPRKLIAAGKLADNAALKPVAAVSVGIVGSQPLLDLAYDEDAAAAVDMNLVMNGAGEYIELQGTGEESSYSEVQLAAMLALGKSGIKQLLGLQQAALR
jgi:ribonuclease PH